MRMKSFFAIAILPAVVHAGDSDSDAYTRAYGPKTTMLIAKPTLRWEVWPGNRAQITEQKMLINGIEVRATYSVRERALLYTPDKPLAPGEYKVKCRVEIDNSLVANKEWSFTVASNAAPALARPDAEQVRALVAANAYRSALGLEPFQLDDRMSGAALAHSRYLSKNGTTGHFQKPGLPGFFGAEPGDRLESFGYIGESWECVSFGSDSPEESVTNLVDAPYHRIPFMQPGPVLLGTGFADQRLTMEFSGNRSEGITVYPAPGQTGVPTQWSGNERPNPLRLHDAPKPVGYVIVFSAWQPGGSKLTVEAASLRNCADGSTVQIFLNTPANDNELDNACFLIPRRPLRAGATYEAYVRGKISASGSQEAVVEKRWRFTTRAGQ